MQPEVSIVQDDSVMRAIQKTAKKLNAKYTKKRKIYDVFLKENFGLKKTVSILLNVFMIFVIVLCALICFSAIVCRANGTVPSFAGYSILQIASGSMEASGFEVGDSIVVKSVNTDTLRTGDLIAFYVYQESSSSFDESSATKLELDPTKTKSNLTLANFFGFQTTELKTASSAGSTLIFHEIVGIYEDSNGERWFQTKGSSNIGVDNWMINENYVVGVYDNSAGAQFVAGFIGALTNDGFLLSMVMIPFLIFAVFLCLMFARDIQRARLELDVVEEKRKLTDDICVKLNIGHHMNTKTKYKVLAQASDDEKAEYVKLLWKDGTAPNSVKKYVTRKEIHLSGTRKLLNLNRECEKMFEEKKDPNKIAEYYLQEKEKIENEQREREERIKKIRRNYT